VRRVRPRLNRGDVLTIRLDDVLSRIWPADNVTAVLRLNENIIRSGALDVVDDLPDRPALPESQSSVVAP
jgi:hypothetical protein